MFPLWVQELDSFDFNFELYASKSSSGTPPEVWKPECVHPSSEVVVRFYFATKFSSEIVSPPYPPPHPTPQPPKKQGGACPSPLLGGGVGWGGGGKNYLATKVSS